MKILPVGAELFGRGRRTGWTDMHEDNSRFSQILRTHLKTGQLMLYREITAVCSQIHTKLINTLCG